MRCYNPNAGPIQTSLDPFRQIDGGDEGDVDENLDMVKSALASRRLVEVPKAEPPVHAEHKSKGA